MKDRIRTNIENRNQPEMRRNASTHKLLPENEFEDFKEWSFILVTFEGPAIFRNDHFLRIPQSFWNFLRNHFFNFNQGFHEHFESYHNLCENQNDNVILNGKKELGHCSKMTTICLNLWSRISLTRTVVCVDKKQILNSKWLWYP